MEDKIIIRSLIQEQLKKRGASFFYLALDAILSLSMEKVHEMTSLVRVKDKLNPLDNQVST